MTAPFAASMQAAATFEDNYRKRLDHKRKAAARHNHAAQIAKMLGVTASGLEELAKAAVRPNGQIGGGNAAYKLERQGYAELFEIAVQTTGPEWSGYRYTRHRITQAGRDLVARARKLGF